MHVGALFALALPTHIEATEVSFAANEFEEPSKDKAINKVFIKSPINDVKGVLFNKLNVSVKWTLARMRFSLNANICI